MNILTIKYKISFIHLSYIFIKQWRAATSETSHAIGMPKPGHKIGFIQEQLLS